MTQRRTLGIVIMFLSIAVAEPVVGQETGVDREMGQPLEGFMGVTTPGNNDPYWYFFSRDFLKLLPRIVSDEDFKDDIIEARRKGMPCFKNGIITRPREGMLPLESNYTMTLKKTCAA